MVSLVCIIALCISNRCIVTLSSAKVSGAVLGARCSYGGSHYAWMVEDSLDNTRACPATTVRSACTEYSLFKVAGAEETMGSFLKFGKVDNNCCYM